VPYLYAIHKGAQARSVATRKPPFGLGMTDEQAKDIESIKHIASSFTDPGEDWNEFQCFDAGGKLVARRRMGGY